MNDDKNTSTNNDGTFKKVKKGFSLLKRLYYIVIIGILIISGVKIALSLKKMHDMGWSFNKNTTEIKVKNSDYDKAMEHWADQDYEEAEQCFKNALETVNSEKGNSSKESAAISQKLGAFYLEEGKYDEAYELLNSAYVTFKKELGEDDGMTIITRAQIASYDIKIGNIEDGFATLNEMFDTTTYAAYKIQICQMLAQCNTQLGNYKKAVDLYDAMAKLYSGFDINNLNKVIMINDYAVLMMTVGNYPAAVEALEGAESEWRKLGLEEDSTLARVYSNLATAYAYNGQSKEAEDTQIKALNIQKKLYGDNNIHVAMSYDALSGMYGAMNDIDKQKDYLEKALDMAIASVGENHMATAVIYYDLGEYYKSVSNYETAIEDHKKALEIRKNILGINNVNTIFVYEALSDDYRRSGLYEDAIENADRAIEISEDMYGRENIYSAHSYITAAWAYSDFGDNEKADRLSHMAIDICDRQKQNSGQTRPYSYQTAGYVYSNAKDKENAIKYLEKALSLYQEKPEDNSRNIATTYIILGDTYLDDKDFDICFSMLYNAKQSILYDVRDADIIETIDTRLDKLYKETESPLSYKEWITEMESKVTVEDN